MNPAGVFVCCSAAFIVIPNYLISSDKDSAMDILTDDVGQWYIISGFVKVILFIFYISHRSVNGLNFASYDRNNLHWN